MLKYFSYISLMAKVKFKGNTQYLTNEVFFLQRTFFSKSDCFKQYLKKINKPHPSLATSKKYATN